MHSANHSECQGCSLNGRDAMMHGKTSIKAGARWLTRVTLRSVARLHCLVLPEGGAKPITSEWILSIYSGFSFRFWCEKRTHVHTIIYFHHNITCQYYFEYLFNALHHIHHNRRPGMIWLLVGLSDWLLWSCQAYWLYSLFVCKVVRPTATKSSSNNLVPPAISYITIWCYRVSIS